MWKISKWNDRTLTKIYCNTFNNIYIYIPLIIIMYNKQLISKLFLISLNHICDSNIDKLWFLLSCFNSWMMEYNLYTNVRCIHFWQLIWQVFAVVITISSIVYIQPLLIPNTYVKWMLLLPLKRSLKEKYGRIQDMHISI